MRISVLILFSSIALFSGTASFAKGLYYNEAAFIAEVFGETRACTKTLWLSGETKQQLQKIFGRKSVGLRQRYWRSGDTTAWVLNEIGKELPITVGVVVEENQIQRIVVMEYRESRGGEVRHDFFTRQFVGAGLKNNLRLNQSIDGITGATLSVRSMKRVAVAAVFMHDYIMEATSSLSSDQQCR